MFRLWPIAFSAVALFLALLLCVCALRIRSPEEGDEQHEDLEEFRNGQQNRDVEANIITPSSPPRVELVKSHLYSHKLQPGESARNLLAALVETTAQQTKSVDSSPATQPQCNAFALWWFGTESSIRTSVRSIRSSIRSAISIGKPECSICLQTYDQGETIAWAKNEKCNHMHHEDCIVEWLSTHDECPLCRANLLQGGPHDEE